MISLTANRKRRSRLPANRLRAGQIRIRLRPSEREAIEAKRLQNLKDGHPHADTLSSWIRHQIEPILNADGNGQPCEIPIELYHKVEELARLLNKSPEIVIEECVAGIENLIHYTNAQRPLIVAEWRLRQQYNQCDKEDL